MLMSFRTLRRVLSHSKDRISDDDKSSTRSIVMTAVGETGRAHMLEHCKAVEEKMLLL